MDTYNRLHIVRGEGKRRDWMKEGEGISQRTYMHGPWTWTTVWGSPEGTGGGAGWRWAKWGRRRTSVTLSTLKLKR